MRKFYSYYNDANAYPVDTDAADCKSLVIPCCFTIYACVGDPEMGGALSDCVGTIRGWLILGQEIERRKPGPFVQGEWFMNLLCSGMSADLGFVVSALRKDCGPLDSIGGVNHFCITEVSFMCQELLPVILESLPEIVFRHLHVFPELVSYYPKPLPHEDVHLVIDDTSLTDLTGNMLAYLAISDETGMEYEMTSEQIVHLRGLYENATSYPAQYIDMSLWEPFWNAGFTEYENTRVLYRSE